MTAGGMVQKIARLRLDQSADTVKDAGTEEI